MPQRPETWEDKALAAFWAPEFKDETLESHARIRAAVSAATCFLIHTYTDTYSGNGSTGNQKQRDGRLHGEHRKDPANDSPGGDPSGQVGAANDGSKTARSGTNPQGKERGVNGRAS